MKLLTLTLISLVALSAQAENIVKIQIGSPEASYSKRDLELRVLRLERAVLQLQQRVFKLEAEKPSIEPAANWICKIKAMGDLYTGVGASKAVATHRATEKCKEGRGGKGFFCKDAVCEN